MFLKKRVYKVIKIIKIYFYFIGTSLACVMFVIFNSCSENIQFYYNFLNF